MLVILRLLKKQKGNIRQGWVGGDTVSQKKNAFYKFTRLEWIWINHVMPTTIDRDHFFYNTPSDLVKCYLGLY